MSGLGFFLVACAVCVAIMAAKPVIFRALDKITGRHHAGR